MRRRATETFGASTIEARSQGRLLIGMYDVLKVAEEMGETAVVFTQQVTTQRNVQSASSGRYNSPTGTRTASRLSFPGSGQAQASS